MQQGPTSFQVQSNFTVYAMSYVGTGTASDLVARRRRGLSLVRGPVEGAARKDPRDRKVVAKDPAPPPRRRVGALLRLPPSALSAEQLAEPSSYTIAEPRQAPLIFGVAVSAHCLAWVRYRYTRCALPTVPVDQHQHPASDTEACWP